MFCVRWAAGTTSHTTKAAAFRAASELFDETGDRSVHVYDRVAGVIAWRPGSSRVPFRLARA